MSVKDYDKLIDLTNMTTGEVVDLIDFDEFDEYSNFDSVYIKCTIGEVRLLKAIDDCISNNHNCLISISYKNK